MKHKASVPVSVERLWNCELEEGQVPLPASKHSSALNIRVLLYLVLNVSSEEHREQVIQGNPSGYDITANNNRKETRGIRRCGTFYVPIALAV